MLGISGIGDAGESVVAGLGQVVARLGEHVTETLQCGDGDFVVFAFDDEVKELIKCTNKFLDGEFDHPCACSASSSSHATTIDDLPALIPVPLAAKILGLSRASAHRYAASGELPTQRLGGRVYVITARIRSLLEGTRDLTS